MLVKLLRRGRESSEVRWRKEKETSPSVDLPHLLFCFTDQLAFLLFRVDSLSAESRVAIQAAFLDYVQTEFVNGAAEVPGWFPPPPFSFLPVFSQLLILDTLF